MGLIYGSVLAYSIVLMSTNHPGGKEERSKNGHTKTRKINGSKWFPWLWDCALGSMAADGACSPAAGAWIKGTALQAPSDVCRERKKPE